MLAAESSRPSNSSGGKVTGTRRIVLPIARSLRIFQNERLLRRISTVGRARGIRQRPRRTERAAGRTFEDDSSGA